MENETDFRSARVGDKLWSPRYGWRPIRKLDESCSMFPLCMSLECGCQWIRMDGKMKSRDIHPSWFWDEIKIEPPPRPRRLVKKFVEIWVNRYQNKSYGGLYNTKEDALEEQLGATGTLIKLTGEYGKL